MSLIACYLQKRRHWSCFMLTGVRSVKDLNQFLSPRMTTSLQLGYTFYESKINDDDNPLWDRFVISAVPTLLAFDNGKIISRRDAKTGVGLSQSDLDSMLNEI
jgi:hypothetical protein